MLFVIEKHNYRDLSHLWLNKLNHGKLHLENLNVLMKPTKNFWFQVVTS